jgi:RNA polymerase sigma-70 factor (ECF subfamily)
VPAALRVIDGADRVARLVASTAPKGWGEVSAARSAIVNGLPGMIFEGRAGVIPTVALEIEDDLVRTIYVVRNPDKLKHLARA